MNLLTTINHYMNHNHNDSNPWSILVLNPLLIVVLNPDNQHIITITTFQPLRQYNYHINKYTKHMMNSSHIITILTTINHDYYLFTHNFSHDFSEDQILVAAEPASNSSAMSIWVRCAAFAEAPKREFFGEYEIPMEHEEFHCFFHGFFAHKSWFLWNVDGISWKLRGNSIEIWGYLFFGLLTHLAIVETRNPGWPTSRS